MNEFLLAEFTTAHHVADAARKAGEAGWPALDVLSPNPVEGIAEHLAPHPGPAAIGWVMVGAGAIGALVGYGMQWFSAVIDYPILSGGRPLDSWPAFLLVPYETAILSAGVIGFLAWLAMCGLPQPHHPLFTADAIERAMQDRYLIVFPRSDRLAAWIEASLNPRALHEIRR